MSASITNFNIHEINTQQSQTNLQKQKKRMSRKDKYSLKGSKANQTTSENNQTFYPKPTNNTYGSFRSEVFKENELQRPMFKVNMDQSQTSDGARGDDEEVADEDYIGENDEMQE